MKARQVTQAVMEKALENVNARFNGNIVFKTFSPKRNGVDFTLTVKSSKEKGARRAQGTGNRLAAACWHVHGYFFEEVFKLAPEAIITSAFARITRHYGNWQDKNIGSIAEPCYYSEACDCK